MVVLLNGFLISFARVTVEQVDDSAAGEAVFAEDVVHDHVVFVGVDADAVAL